jgi:hypothetical protein
VLYQARAQWDNAADSPIELAFAAGELLSILDDSDTDWWVAKNESGQRVGKIPKDYVIRE